MKVLSCLWFLTISAFIAFLPEHARAQMPGDTVGTTQVVFQSNGPTGNRIVIDEGGCLHFTWMRYSSYPSARHVYYNCIPPSGELFPGVEASHTMGAGFPQIGVVNNSCALILYHTANANAESLFAAIDVFNCFGAFDYYRPSNRIGNSRFIWPYCAVDTANRIHVIATGTAAAGERAPFIYTRSSDGGITWTPPRIVDTVLYSSAVIACSRISNRAAIIYRDPTHNDIFYINTLDRFTLDFDNWKVNITDYGYHNDTLMAHNDLDALYDFDDRLHIIWVARRPTGPNGEVLLFHYDTGSQVISQVTRFTMPERDSCQFPSGALSIHNVSLAVSPNDILYVVYTRFDSSDCSRRGEANGELFAQASFDGGLTWGLPTNITNTPSPGCVQPNCLSEIYPSMAEKADDYLHIFYVGYRGYGAPQHLMLYYAFPTALLGATEPAEVPRNFTLYQNYPNPFNAATTIGFDLTRAGQARLEVFDITGAKVATLLDERKTAGHYEVIWDATGQTSGIYFARLECEGLFRSVKLILLK